MTAWSCPRFALVPQPFAYDSRSSRKVFLIYMICTTKRKLWSDIMWICRFAFYFSVLWTEKLGGGGGSADWRSRDPLTQFCITISTRPWHCDVHLHGLYHVMYPHLPFHILCRFSFYFYRPALVHVIKSLIFLLNMGLSFTWHSI